MWEDVGSVGATTLALYPRGVTTVEVRWLGSAGAVKGHSKNDLMHHLTPRMTCPIHRRIRQPYMKWSP
jgi:hypothetical protein